MTIPALTPDRDPFHTACDGLADALPGAVLGTREVTLAAASRIRMRARARQLRYRTTDLRGRAEVGVTTVVTPAAPARGILSYQCAIDAVSSRCFPSYALRHGSRADGALARIELPLILAAVRRGWAVSIPDHEGPRGHFGAAREPGYRVLDGVRATHEHLRIASRGDTPVGLWGYSGGGLATVWAAEEAGTYAPELHVVGTVAGAPVGDPGAAFRRLNGGRFAGFPLVFIAGLCRAYPELHDVLDRHVAPRFRDRIADTEQRTTLDVLARLTFRSIDGHLNHGLDALLDDPVLTRVIDDIRPGRRKPHAPVLIQQGERDEVIAAADVRALAERYRALGGDVTYREFARGWHLPLQFAGAPGALRWLDARATTAAAESGSSDQSATRTVSISSNACRA
ncbi:MAG: lipase family protein [Gordonia sp. (in: high G+C Gram-positive bacteria)]|uniref:lipase family protein n=1 Tax=Gordonia sp. (in: high G+C Gram-positive bacteria) TaxID=84139 RepID=UPI0039E54B9E